MAITIRRCSKPLGPWNSTSVALLASITLFTPQVCAQNWVPGQYLTQTINPCPPFIFQAMDKSRSAFGTDAAEDSTLEEIDLGDAGKQLLFMAPNRPQPFTLFPDTANPAFTALQLPASAVVNGSVHEPTVYHDIETNQYWVIFSFAIDVVARDLSRPCDLFAMNITYAVNNPSAAGATLSANLPIVRLTNVNSGLVNPTPSQLAQRLYDRAFNSKYVTQMSYLNGVAWQGVGGVALHYETNTGACVVDEEHGPVLYFASNRRRADGPGMMASDLRFKDANGAPTCTLLNTREIQQFGTTSMLTFFETPNGAGGSYRSNTESTGQWQVFEFRSDEAQWQTISGYANQANIADHNGTTVAIGGDPNASLLAISRYYIGNNESFGTVIVLPYSEVGRNNDDARESVRQIGAIPTASGPDTNLFPQISEIEDLPSAVGKFAHPAAGRASGSTAQVQLFMTYSPTPSKGAGTYDAKLVAVTRLDQQILASSNNSFLPAQPAAGDRVQLVLEHPTRHAFWMKPILTHKERFGWKHRRVMPLKGKASLAGLPSNLANMPVAQITAGPIYDTDVRPIARRRASGQGAYDPTTELRNNSGTDKLFLKLACLTKDVPNVAPSDAWGVRIYITDSKVRRLMAPSPEFGFKALFPRTITDPPLWGYLHHNGDGPSQFGAPIHYERYRHLSDVPADGSGKINLYLPANVPVKLFLLHADGTVLAPHRNHHSFAPGQLENRCAGCHQHASSTPAFATSTTAPFDTLSQTGKWERTPGGPMTFNVYPVPSMDVPEFDEVHNMMHSECGQCHDSTRTPPPGLGGASKFDLSMSPVINWTQGGQSFSQAIEQKTAVWAWLHKQRYVNRRLGAAKSPLAWYFYGVDSDSQLRLDGEPNSRYKNLPGSRYWITTNVGGVNPHATSDGALTYGVADRSKVGRVIEWIEGGAAIDHNMAWPNSSGNDDPHRGVNGDSYQIAVTAKLEGFFIPRLVVGYWDAFNNISTVKVSVRGIPLTPHSPTGNGSHVFDMTSVPSIGELDTVRVEVTDTASNRTVLEKSVRELIVESETHRGAVALSLGTAPPLGTWASAFTVGQQANFMVKAPQFPAALFYLIMSEGIYPGYGAIGLNADLSLLPNLDGWFVTSIAGLRGPLDGAGNGSWGFPVPSGLPPTELYCVAGVLAPGGKIAKSNIVSIKF